MQQDPLDGAVLYAPEQERYTLWYRPHSRLMSSSYNHATGQAMQREGAGTCLATSADGIPWEPHVPPTLP